MAAFFHGARDPAAAEADAQAALPAQPEELSFWAFFGGCFQESHAERANAISSVRESLLQAARDDQDSRKHGVAQSASPGGASPAELLQAHLPQVLRLALACPLTDVRDSMRALLRDLAAIDSQRYSKYVAALEFAFRPSNFVPLSSCVDPSAHAQEGTPVPAAVGGESDACSEANSLLLEIFFATGRVSHMDLLMAWHPSYLAAYSECLRHLMESAGPLPTPWRNYLAIMAASRHQCDYLIALQENEFILAGGDASWLKGIAHAPKKLQSLCELNALLAHQPWLITRNHISALTAGAGADSWSVAELVHALVILSTFHALCGFVGGLGVRMEIDAMDWNAWDPAKAPAPAPLLRKNAVPEATLPAIANISTAIPLISPQTAVSPSQAPLPKATVSDKDHLLHLLANSNRHLDVRSNADNAFDGAALEEDFNTSPAAATGDAHRSSAYRAPSDLSLDSLSGHTSQTGTSSSTTTTSSGMIGGLTNLLRQTHLDSSSPATKYLLSPSDAPSSTAARLASLRYVNFDVNSKSYSTFFLHDFTWKQHGYALVNRYYQGFADMLVRRRLHGAHVLIKLRNFHTYSPCVLCCMYLCATAGPGMGSHLFAYLQHCLRSEGS
jgi:hypothetical protein